MGKSEIAAHYQIAMEDIAKRSPNITVEDADKQAKAAAVKAAAAYEEDKTFYRILIILLAGIVLTVVIGSFIIIATGHDTTDGIIAIGSAAAGALVGIFATTKK